MMPGSWPEFRFNIPEPSIRDATHNPYRDDHYLQRGPPCKIQPCYCDHSSERIRHDHQRSLDQMDALESGLHNAQRTVQSKDQIIEALRIQLFHSYRIAKQYVEAERIYNEVLAVYSNGADLPNIILELQYSFVEMLMVQKRFNEAKGLAEDVFETRKAVDTSSQEYKQSHRQVCSIYSSLKEFQRAERYHRSVYHNEPQDSWALENGDGLCRQLVKQGKHEQAEPIQVEVWRKRQTLENHGPRHELTMQSGLMAIKILEKLRDTTIDNEASEHSLQRKQWYEACIDQRLKELWGLAEIPETMPKLLDVGHKWGSRLLAWEKYEDAEAILSRVWEGKKTILTATDKTTLSTGTLLATAMKLQGSTEKLQEAARLYGEIRDRMKANPNEDETRMISVVADLAATLSQLGQYTGVNGAEELYGWLLKQKETKLDPPQNGKLADARYNLAKVIYAQEPGRSAGLLRQVYDTWYKKSPSAHPTLECGFMLVRAYEDQAARDPTAVEQIQKVFTGRRKIVKRDLLFLESGRVLGKLLLNQGNFRGAREPLSLLWEYQPALPEEKKVRLWCGELYGRSLIECRSYELARSVLRSVQSSLGEVFGDKINEGPQVADLLAQAQLIPPGSPRSGRKKQRAW